MLKCDCVSIKCNQRETQSPRCKGTSSSQRAVQATQPPPTPKGTAQALHQGSLRGCQCVASSQAPCFPWQLSRVRLLWEGARWVPFVFSGLFSTRWWPGCSAACCLVSWYTSIFNPSHFLETQRAQCLQETRSWFSSLLPRGLSSRKEAHVPREEGRALARGLKACSQAGPRLDEKGKESRGEERERRGPRRDSSWS